MQNPKQIVINVNQDDELTAQNIADDIKKGLSHLKENQPELAVQQFKITLIKCRFGSVLYDVVMQNLLVSYRDFFKKSVNSKKSLHTNNLISEVLEIDLTSRNSADTIKEIGMDFLRARQYDFALMFIRRAIEISPCPSYFVDLTNALAWIKSPAKLADYTTNFTEADIGQHIFITCAPKSGSTFLKNVLVEITNFKDLFSVYASLQNEQEIDLPQLVRFGNVDTVTQQHSRASEANIQLMQAFGISPVILVRNIFDTVMSLVDFYKKGFIHSTFFNKEDFLNFNEETKIDLIIEFAIPWYFQFVASWQNAEAENRLDVYWLTYEEMIVNKTDAVAKILSFYGLEFSQTFIKNKIFEVESNREVNRFNKGITGRGLTELSKAQKDRISNLARYFPSNDFSLLGI
jgi:hypothetical protein